MTHHGMPRQYDASEFSELHALNARHGCQVFGFDPAHARHANAIWGTLPAYVGINVPPMWAISGSSPSVHASHSILES